MMVLVDSGNFFYDVYNRFDTIPGLDKSTVGHSDKQTDGNPTSHRRLCILAHADTRQTLHCWH